MYLADTINKVLDSRKDRLIGSVAYPYIVTVLNRAFSKVEPFKFKLELYKDYSRNDFSVSGIYDMEKDVRYIILNFPKNYKKIFFNEERWEEFRFAVSQVCQHEAIHKLQWQRRDGSDGSKVHMDFRCVDVTREEERNYLNDTDEIDAYAHDIAMEIKFFYPDKDPYSVLQRVGRYRKIWSYRYYKKTFNGTDWSPIKKRLLKKTFRWMPYTVV